MAYGLKITNTYNTVQVDDTYKNLSLKSTGTVSTDLTSVMGQAVQISTTGTNPRIAINCSYYFAILGMSYSSGTYTFTVGVAAASSVSLTYYIFDEPQTLTSSDYALKVLDSSSAVTFDSRLKYMKVVGFFDKAWSYTGSYANPDSNYSSYTYTSGPNYALMKADAGMGAWSYYNPDPNLYYVVQDLCVCKMQSANVFYAGYLTITDFPGGSGTSSGNSSRMLVLDVSNI